MGEVKEGMMTGGKAKAAASAPHSYSYMGLAPLAPYFTTKCSKMREK